MSRFDLIVLTFMSDPLLIRSSPELNLLFSDNAIPLHKCMTFRVMRNVGIRIQSVQKKGAITAYPNKAPRKNEMSLGEPKGGKNT